MVEKRKDEPGLIKIMLIVTGFGLFCAWLKEPSEPAAPAQVAKQEAKPYKKPAPQIKPREINAIIAQAPGCKNQDTLSKLFGYATEQDEDAFTKELERDLISGDCAMFKKGDKVFVEDTTFSQLVKIRRKGDTEEYWTWGTAITGTSTNQ